ALAGPATGAGRAGHRAGHLVRRAGQLYRTVPRRRPVAGRTHRSDRSGARAAAVRPVRPAPGTAGGRNRAHRTRAGGDVNGPVQPEDDTPARRVLERLLRRAERAMLAGDAQPATLPMDGKRDGAEYRALRGVADFDAFHARIALAERAGAITATRDRHRDDGERLLRLTVRDVAALARDLRIELLGERVVRAEALLAQWSAPYPCS